MHTPPPASRANRAGAKRSNWGLRLLAVALSALAFLGFWRAAARTPAAATPTSGSEYAPPANGQGGLLPPGGLGNPHGSTRLS